MFLRYAIFYTPPPGVLADFCASWLGWSSDTGQHVPHPEGTGADIGTLTEVPRKYGFHGTLKAPFRLADGRNVDELSEALAAYAAAQPPLMLEQMALQHHHGFLALRPNGDVTALRALAADIVQHFDGFRAPATAAEMARRRQSGLSARQDQNLINWGYPYVLDDFHFHLTLSGRLDQTAGRATIKVLERLLTPLLPQPFPIDHLTLLGQDRDGFFHVLHRYALT